MRAGSHGGDVQMLFHLRGRRGRIERDVVLHVGHRPWDRLHAVELNVAVHDAGPGIAGGGDWTPRLGLDRVCPVGAGILIVGKIRMVGPPALMSIRGQVEVWGRNRLADPRDASVVRNECIPDVGPGVAPMR